MVQTRFSKAVSAAFTGHRSCQYSMRDCIKARLRDSIFKAYEHGIRNFISGFAIGFDMLAAEENNSRRGRPALHNKVIRFCTMADDDKVTKIRTIAAREGIAIKDLMNLAFDKIINEYEKKYGTVRLPKVKKGGDVSKVFDLS